MLRFQLSSSCQ